IILLGQACVIREPVVRIEHSVLRCHVQFSMERVSSALKVQSDGGSRAEAAAGVIRRGLDSELLDHGGGRGKRLVLAGAGVVSSNVRRAVQGKRAASVGAVVWHTVDGDAGRSAAGKGLGKSATAEVGRIDDARAQRSHQQWIVIFDR